MQEALAAATIMATKWDRQSHFVNPMCGSGTLAIEAALIATNKAVGLMRNNFGFMHIMDYDPQVWKDMRQAASKEIKRNLPFKIIATDIDPKAIRAAEINAREAMVDHLIVFKVLPFEQTILPPAPGVIMMNPEYGERMGEEEQLEDIYKQIGDFLKQKASGYTAYVFTANMELAKKIGLKASRRIEFYNSTLDSRLLEYEMYQGSKREPRQE
jgi:putative N6-adenine-specific DNA methylase